VDSEARLELAVKAAHDAGSLLLERFHGPAHGVGTKSSSTDLVSDADRDSEALIFRAILKAHPRDGMLGEEGKGKVSESGFEWVVDPLDGTVNFLFGIPWWAVSIAIRDDNGALAGVVHNPILEETFSAQRGEGAWLNGEAIGVSECDDISQALIATGFAYDRDARRVQGEAAARVLPVARDLRRMGSAALDLCSVACGRVDGFFEAHLAEWDKAAAQLIAREAGALVEEIGPPVPGLEPGLLATNGKIQEELKLLVEGT
jgi:myo-inositol-1(or 4)-monophosphatase